MAAQEDRSGLEIFEDAAWQRRTWQVERVAWVVMLGVVTAALLGVFGGGWLASARESSDDGRLSLEYERFCRNQSPSMLRIETSAIVPGSNAVRLWVSRDYFDAVSVEPIMPPPERVEAAEDRIVFELAVSERAKQIVVLLPIEPLRSGPITGRVGIVEGEEISFRQFIFP